MGALSSFGNNGRIPGEFYQGFVSKQLIWIAKGMLKDLLGLKLQLLQKRSKV